MKTCESLSFCLHANKGLIASQPSLFRTTDPAVPKLLIYRNSKSVIIGRNQNPWTEAKVENLRKHDVPLIRRWSGGGTVYHDEGNTNYSIMIPRGMFDRKATGELVVRALRSIGLPNIRLNQRHDICLGLDKVSGSAYKLTRERAYHHGTMLINSDLTSLHELLHPSQAGIVSKATDSVRSPVTNLRSVTPALTHSAFAEALAQAFLETYHNNSPDPSPHLVVRDQFEGQSVIEEGMKELQSWEWTFGQTPEFSHMLSALGIRIHVRHGKINAVDVPDSPSHEHRLQAALVGMRYGEFEGGLEEALVRRLMKIREDRL
ncbi:hypothetical protein CROQUDRAFT_683740 [Cronartium quercuum f. sp. fusiforme G11]|uniref:Putative lipoate-protein ligase A n=1 Tax=Cronartium quercuum f. sp. fusiforme G11 TaxID=708437 RepID=A0A9P6NUS3_9BASI|nr:hypothetical protein CROQUDRAFT_683740 [Cronartium quercuum f. sp. fusiforme G11]